MWYSLRIKISDSTLCRYIEMYLATDLAIVWSVFFKQYRRFLGHLAARLASPAWSWSALSLEVLIFLDRTHDAVVSHKLSCL
jgi:hypothetical protein